MIGVIPTKKKIETLEDLDDEAIGILVYKDGSVVFMPGAFGHEIRWRSSERVEGSPEKREIKEFRFKTAGTIQLRVLKEME